MSSNGTRVLRDDGGEELCTCEVAETAASRTRGLLGRDRLDQGRALLLRPASSVHTAFMRFPIDVVFLDRRLTVLKVRAGLRPWRASGCLRARAVLELAGGECARLGIDRGSRLTLD